MAARIRKGDVVLVTTGKSKGQRGEKKQNKLQIKTHIKVNPKIYREIKKNKE
jgi:ribosomal protein L24